MLKDCSRRAAGLSACCLAAARFERAALASARCLIMPHMSPSNSWSASGKSFCILLLAFKKTAPCQVPNVRISRISSRFTGPHQPNCCISSTEVNLADLTRRSVVFAFVALWWPRSRSCSTARRSTCTAAPARACPTGISHSCSFLLIFLLCRKESLRGRKSAPRSLSTVLYLRASLVF